LEPSEDLYNAVAMLSADCPADVIKPLYVRFFLDSALSPEAEERGEHVLNALSLMWPGRMPDIEGLSVDYFRLKSLTAIVNFPHLRALSIAGCREITEFSPLARLTSLEVLRLDGTQISDLSWVTALPRLRILSLRGCANAGNAIGALKDLKNIRVLGSGIAGFDKGLLEPQVETAARTQTVRKSIHAAVRDGDTTKVAAPLQGKPDLVFSKDDDGETPLHLATAAGHIAIMKLLIAKGADVNSVTGKEGLAALHLATALGHKDAVALLLSSKAKVNSKSVREAVTPLRIAAACGQKDVAALLLANKADTNAKDGSGWTPLHATAWNLSPSGERLSSRDYNGEAIASLLLDNNADVNAEGRNGWTPLHMAASRDRLGLAELLLTRKANINRRSNDGDMPLHIAARMGFKEIVTLLLANKADINATNKYGDTPMGEAANAGHTAVAKLLRRDK
jgi:ankyrin repeat protein